MRAGTWPTARTEHEDHGGCRACVDVWDDASYEKYDETLSSTECEWTHLRTMRKRTKRNQPVQRVMTVIGTARYLLGIAGKDSYVGMDREGVMGSLW